MNTFKETWMPVYKHNKRHRMLFPEANEVTEWEVSDMGNVRKSGNLIDLEVDYMNYLRIPGTMYYVHRLVAESFLWETVRDTVRNHENVHHINGNKSDNRAVNLRFLSKAQHKCLHGVQALKARIVSTTKNISKLKKQLRNPLVEYEYRMALNRLKDTEMELQKYNKKWERLLKYD